MIEMVLKGNKEKGEDWSQLTEAVWDTHKPFWGPWVSALALLLILVSCCWIAWETQVPGLWHPHGRPVLNSRFRDLAGPTSAFVGIHRNEPVDRRFLSLYLSNKGQKKRQGRTNG